MSDGAKESVELLPCPFCGGDPAITIGVSPRGQKTVDVVCQDCSATVPAFCESDAITDWNTRATPPAAPAGGEGEAVAYWVEHPKFGMELSLDPPNEDAERRGWVAKPLYLAAPAQSASGHDIEAAIERIISIRNGMTPDLEARAIVRRELAALGAAAQSNGGEGTFERVFQDACNEAGCGYDNELLLTTIKGFLDRLAKARAALEMCQKALAVIIEPKAIKTTSVIHAFALATEAECAARTTLREIA